MSDIPVDQRRNPETMQRINSIAAAIFQRHGVAFDSAKRAGGWSNATWLSAGLALRLAVDPGRDSIRREARLAALFPAEVGYPPILETGETDGYEWSLSKRIPGQNLAEVWPSLGWDQRITAIRQLWHKVEAVHSVDAAAAAHLTLKETRFYAPDAQTAAAGLARLRQQNLLTHQELKALEKALDRFWQARSTATPVLNHGDFTTENALWDQGKVVSLLDFEYAQVAPDELDLNELVKLAFAPLDRMDPLPDPGQAGLSQLRQAVVGLAMPMLAHPGSKDLLLGYAILLETWSLADRLTYPDEECGIDQKPLFQILASLADWPTSYLGPILAAY